jgi:hypothetical protein
MMEDRARSPVMDMTGWRALDVSATNEKVCQYVIFMGGKESATPA